MFLFHFRRRAEGERNECLPGDTHLDCTNTFAPAAERVSSCRCVQKLSLVFHFTPCLPPRGKRVEACVYKERAASILRAGKLLEPIRSKTIKRSSQLATGST